MDVDRGHATRAVEHLVDAIVRAVQKGDSVTITGFGCSSVAAAAPGRRNPRTGETVRVRRRPFLRSVPARSSRRLSLVHKKLPAEGPAVREAPLVAQ